MTQGELAQVADLSMLTVSKAERGTLVDVSTVKKLAEALGVDVGALYSRDIEQALTYQSVFISYGTPDEDFAARLYRETFFFPKTARPGDKLHRTMSEGVRDYDRVLLVCSKSSLERPGVLHELELVLAREAQEGGADILIPVTLDGYIYSGWKPVREDVATQIRARVILSFEGSLQGGPEFDARFARLLTSLEVRPEF